MVIFSRGGIGVTIIWREQLRVGNDVIDDDHRHLIDIINRIGTGLKNDNPFSIRTDLNCLHEYSLLHFEREEKIAFAAGYEHAPHLHQSHRILMERLAQIRKAVIDTEREWSPQLRREFHDFLRNWLIDHVIREDLQMKPLLQKFPPAFSPE